MALIPPLSDFPIRRTLLAFLIIPVLTLLPTTLGSALGPQSPFDHDPRYARAAGVLLSPILAVFLAVPGYIVFALVGGPTIYLLYRSNHTGFTVFAIFGALYTFLPCLVLAVPRPFNRAAYVENLRFLALFLGVIGAINGMLTRLVVFGFRQHSATSRSAPRKLEATSPLRQFPIVRTFLAFLVIPLLTLLPAALGAALAPDLPYEHNSRYLRVVSALFLRASGTTLAWSGYLIFLAIGLPTIYLLYRADQTDFGVFAVFGALYTPISCLVLAHPHPFHGDLFVQQLRVVPGYAVLGALIGLLTRLIIFGRRNVRLQSPAS